MTLTFHTEYSLRILIYLMLHPDRVIPTREIAESFKISINHLNKVSQNLVSLNIVNSSRGRSGGIKLIDASLDLKLGNLVKSLGPSTEMAKCAGGKELAACVISPVCSLRGMLAGAQQAFWTHLNQFTVADLAAKNAEQMRILLGS